MNQLEKLYSKYALFMHIILRLSINAGQKLFTFAQKPKTHKNPKKILVLATLRLGDLIMTLPLYEALREHYPDAHLTVLIHPAFDPVFENIPSVNQTIPYYGKGKTLVKLFKKIRKYQFDLCINVCEGHLNPLIYASGISRRIGFQQKHPRKDAFYLTDALKCSAEFKGISHFFLELLKPLNIKNAPAQPKLLKPQKSYPFKSQAKFRIAVHAGSKEQTKIWPFYPELIKTLSIHYPSTEIIITGSKGETHPVNGGAERILDLIGQTSLAELVQLYASVDLVIGNDTGPLHIARALGTPSLTLFGPITENILSNIQPEKDLYLSKEVPCRPKDAQLFGIPLKGLQRCRLSTCQHHTCMQLLTVEHVLKRIYQLLPREEFPHL